MFVLQIFILTSPYISWGFVTGHRRQAWIQGARRAGNARLPIAPPQ